MTKATATAVTLFALSFPGDPANLPILIRSDCKENPRITPEENLFIQCLLASADYESFYSVMIKEAKKLIVMKNAGKIYDGPTEIASPTAEGKEGDLDDFEDLGIDDGESKDARK